MSALFAPVLLFLFGVAFPLGGWRLQTTTGCCWCWVTRWPA